ncbi:unnamed protein product [Fusarium graminearum]|uniref:Uncharacterized protein n=1 Tax=Gibberella zeae TaxID=5518 RepID=A0A9N8RN14_GIBZA|nr:unnamed protein product [Fusarium graminearum]
MPSPDLADRSSKGGPLVPYPTEEFLESLEPSPARPYGVSKAVSASRSAEPGQPGVLASTSHEGARPVVEYGPPGLTLSMQVKLNNIGRDLDTLNDTIHFMQGVQEAQNTTIRRLLGCQKYLQVEKGPHKSEDRMKST